MTGLGDPGRAVSPCGELGSLSDTSGGSGSQERLWPRSGGPEATGRR